MCLYSAGDGLASGFQVIDITQWGGDITRACEASFVLHLLPVVLVNLDLWCSRDTLARAYEGTTGRGWTFSILSGWVLPSVYQVVMTVKHGSIEVAMHTLYRIPMANIDLLMHLTRLMYLSVGLLSIWHVRNTLAAARAVMKEA